MMHHDRERNDQIIEINSLFLFSTQVHYFQTCIFIPEVCALTNTEINDLNSALKVNTESQAELCADFYWREASSKFEGKCEASFFLSFWFPLKRIDNSFNLDVL